MTVRLSLFLGLSLGLLLALALSACSLGDLPWKNPDGSSRSFLPPADFTGFDSQGNQTAIWCRQTCASIQQPPL